MTIKLTNLMSKIQYNMLKGLVVYLVLPTKTIIDVVSTVNLYI